MQHRLSLHVLRPTVGFRPWGVVQQMKLLYKPFGLIVSVLGEVLAGVLFKRVWPTVADDREAPNAKDQDRHGAKWSRQRSSKGPSSAQSRR